ncbi:hypothetical protein AB0I72_17685 [Nocardiopsis sp. NPDC049922]|uniref:hypothetical protein n=1 Tax=Nocardiopsis sp. NPDC049922 TaxID=3155157 RepID=UPI0033DF2B8C
MTATDSTNVDARRLLALATRHLDDEDSRRPITEIPTLDESTSLPFRPFASLALAMAAHVLSAWEVRTFQVERADPRERIRYFTAVGDDPRLVFRACTLFVPEHGTQRVVELCGHSFCSNRAPAAPGSRCADHLGDPAPGNLPLHGRRTEYPWLDLAVEAARYGRAGLTEKTLAVHAIRAGLSPEEVRRALDMPTWTLHALTDGPAPIPDDVEESDDPDQWPLVLTPLRDITAADTRRVYEYSGGEPTEPGPDTLLAREGDLYIYFPVRENGPLMVIGEDDYGFTLEWWQMQEHLPQHRLARRADDRRREMYEPPCACGECVH